MILSGRFASLQSGAPQFRIPEFRFPESARVLNPNPGIQNPEREPMNNTCPSCGALYNVARKDIGRRISCKKCSAALVVTEAGLEIEQPATASSRPAPVINGVDDVPDVEEEVVPSRRGRSSRRGGGGLNIDPVQLFKDFGGVATLLFGFGAFLVIVFLFMPMIGSASVQRAQGAVERMELEWKTKERKMRKENKSPDEISKAREEFFKGKDDLEDDVQETSISNKRSHRFDLYGMLFGFLFLMAGSLGFLMPGHTIYRRILGTVVLGAQILIIFMVFAGEGCRGKGPL